MRLWHKDLIPYLPRQQLLGQWRELNSIYKLKNRHILINFVYEYDKGHLYCYSLLVMKEMQKRHYKINLTNFNNYFGEDFSLYPYTTPVLDTYKGKMTPRYLKQCLYNLQEKHDCGGITDEEWKVITDHFDIE